MTQNNVELRSPGYLRNVLIRKYVLDELISYSKDMEAALNGALSSGEKIEVTNAQGVKLGSVSMSKPAPKAVPDSHEVAMGMAQDMGFEIIDTLPDPESDKGRELIDYLFENAPQFLDMSISRDDAKTMQEKVLEDWQITGKTPLGWQIQHPAGKLTVTKLRQGTKNGDIARKAVEHILSEMKAPLLELEALTGDK